MNTPLIPIGVTTFTSIFHSQLLCTVAVCVRHVQGDITTEEKTAAAAAPENPRKSEQLWRKRSAFSSYPLRHRHHSFEARHRYTSQHLQQGTKREAGWRHRALPEESGLCGSRTEWRCCRVGTIGVAVLGAPGQPIGYRSERNFSVRNVGVVWSLSLGNVSNASLYPISKPYRLDFIFFGYCIELDWGFISITNESMHVCSH